MRNLGCHQTALVLCLLAVLGPLSDCALAKRFDCRVFCQQTGFHGTVGGCRCSFTLFTSKRQDPSAPLLSGASSSNRMMEFPPLQGPPLQHDDLERYVRI